MPGKTFKQQAAEMKHSLFIEGLVDEYFTRLESFENEENPNFVEESITVFFNDSAVDIATVDELLKKDVVDLNAIWSKLNKIYGLSCCIGVVTIARKAKEAREYCQQQNLESFIVSFNEMKEENDKMKGKLEAYVQLLKLSRAGNRS